MAFETYETELTQITFSPSKNGNYKFSKQEKETLLEIVKTVEKYLIDITGFSIEQKKGIDYKVPVIFEKLSNKTHKMKHSNKYAFMQEVDPDKLRNWMGIPIVSKTYVVFLGPEYKNEFWGNIAHEIIHVVTNSYLTGINSKNYDYFLEGLTEFLTSLIKTHKEEYCK